MSFSIHIINLKIMNKSDLIKKIAEKAKISNAQASASFEAFWDTVKEELNNGNEVNMMGIGKISVTSKPERDVRNPMTGKMITTPASKKAKFKLTFNL